MDARRYAACLPLLLAILTAAILQTILIVRAPTISADGIVFTSIARDLSDDPVAAIRRHDQHPGYPAAMLAVTRAVQWLGYHAEPESWMVGGRTVCFVCGLLSVWVVWMFARDLYDTRVANLAAFVFAVLPLARANASDAQSDIPHTLFFLIAAWLATSAVASGRLLPLAGAGIASAIAYWIRPEGLEVFLVAMMVAVWMGIDKQWSWRKVGLACATLAGVTLVVAAPYPILSGKFTSKQLPFFKQQSAPTFIAQRAEVAPDETAVATTTVDARVDVQAAASPAKAHPAAIAEPSPNAAARADLAPTPAAHPSLPDPAQAEPERRYTVGLLLRLAGSAIGALAVSFCYGFRYVFIPLYLLGQWEMVRRRTPSRIILFLWALALFHCALLFWVFFVSGYIASRHVLPLVGLAMPFTALGILFVEEKLSGMLRVKPPRIAVATLAVCTLFVLPYSVRSYNREFVPVIEATRWVDARADRDVGIVCNSPYVGYYGTLPTTNLGPDATTLDSALAQGEQGVRYDYVVLHVGAHDYRPEWMAQIEQRYRLVRAYEDPTAFDRPRRVMVFEAIDSQARRRPSGPAS